MPDNDPINRYASKSNGELPTSEAADVVVSLGKCGFVLPKGAKALDVEIGADPVDSFQYVYLSVRAHFSPTSFWVVFVGMESWKVTVEGRNLRHLYDRINDHCLRKIRTIGRDMEPDDGKPVVTSIKVENVTPKEKN